ncbi:MAG: cysteine--tRNA ligase [Planctomycetota bacterium]
MSVLRLHNTLGHTIEPFAPADPSRITFYTCGLTVYDDGHIGNFRAFLAADLLRRWLESPLCNVTAPDGSEHAGPRTVRHVMNVTDVGHMTDDDAADGGGEDKMSVAGERLLEAKKSGKLPPDANVDPGDPRAIAAFFTQRFVEDAKAVGLKVVIEAEQDPTLLPRATDHVPHMIALIETLIERGHAYAVGDAGAQAVYFDVRSFPEYGKLSNNSIDELSAGAGGRIQGANQAQKKHPADFLLWKADPSHLMKWPSPWGEGYPGWHIECSAMALERLAGASLTTAERSFGDATIDVHSGGEDNVFPHHECEIAQSCAATGADRFARHWFHVRFLFVEGEKMSKSKGNFFTIRRLLDEGHEPAAVRLEIIKTHYGSKLDFRRQGLKDAAKVIDRWRRFVAAGEGSAQPGEVNAAVRSAFADAMHDDLNIAKALGAINKWIGETPTPTKADAELMRVFDATLGLLELERPAEEETSIGVFLGGLAPDAAVIERLEARAEARAAKDFAASDAIRDELAGMGYAIKDIAGGKVEVSRA